MIDNTRCPLGNPDCEYQPVCHDAQCSHGVGMQYIHCEADAEVEATGDVEVDGDNEVDGEPEMGNAIVGLAGHALEVYHVFRHIQSWHPLQPSRLDKGILPRQVILRKANANNSCPTP